MIIGQTNGKKTTEFWLSMLIVAVGLCLIIVEVMLHIWIGKGLGINVEHVFYAIMGTGLGYKASRTYTKGKTIAGLNYNHSVEADLEKSRNNSNNSPNQPVFPAPQPNLGPDEDTTKMSAADFYES